MSYVTWHVKACNSYIYPILEQLAYEHVGQLMDNQGLKLFDSQVGPQTLLLSWHSKPEGLCAHVKRSAILQESVREARGHQDNKLELWGDAPRYEYSTVPLMRADGLRPVSNPKAGSRGHALLLNDKQVRSACVTLSSAP